MHWPEAFSVAHEVVWNVVAVLAVLAYLGTWLALRGNRIGSVLDVEAAVAHVERIRRDRPGRPVAILGHDGGGGHFD